MPRPAAKRREKLWDQGEALRLQGAFLAKLGPQQPFREVFQYLPEISFFVKDRQSRMICASPAIVERLGAREESELIGRTDFDFFPPHVAEHFVQDDRWVMRSGRPLIGRVETWYNERRLLDWFVTNKLPLRDAAGAIVGVMGTVHSYDERKRMILPFSQISRVVDHIRAHHQRRFSMQELAGLAHLSARQLHRKFREVFGMSVREFLLKTRIQAASDALLAGEGSISEIALQFGFCDQSAFTQQFRKHTGLTPLKYRRKYASLAGGQGGR